MASLFVAYDGLLLFQLSLLPEHLTQLLFMLFDLLLPLEVDRADKHGDFIVLLKIPPFVILYCLDLVILHVSQSHYILAWSKLLNLMIHGLWTDEELLLVRRYLVQGLFGHQ